MSDVTHTMRCKKRRVEMGLTEWWGRANVRTISPNEPTDHIAELSNNEE